MLSSEEPWPSSLSSVSSISKELLALPPPLVDPFECDDEDEEEDDEEDDEVLF